MEIDGSRTDPKRTAGFLAGGALDDLREHGTFAFGEQLPPWKCARQNRQRVIERPDLSVSLIEFWRFHKLPLAAPPGDREIMSPRDVQNIHCTAGIERIGAQYYHRT